MPHRSGPRTATSSTLSQKKRQTILKVRESRRGTATSYKSTDTWWSVGELVTDINRPLSYYWPPIDRYIDRYNRSIVDWYSVKYRWSIGEVSMKYHWSIDRYMFIDRPSNSIYISININRLSTDLRSSIDRLSTESRSIVDRGIDRYIDPTLPIVLWHVGGVLPYMGCIGMCGPKVYGFSAVLFINSIRSHNRGRRP